MKRFYIPNRNIKAKGYTLKITSGGTVYHDDRGTFRRLETMWLKKLRQLSVILPDESEVRLKPMREGGIEVVEQGLGL